MEKCIVLDLEMCRIGKEYRKKEFPHQHEIIQIGAVKMNEEGQIIDTFSIYVHPIYGRVDHFIQELTGISEKMLTYAPEIQDALQLLMDWTGPDYQKVYTWSASDRSQLFHEIDSKHIHLTNLKTFMQKDHWIDYQKIFGKRYKFSWAMSLKQALEMTGIETEGHEHNGLDDAYNTAKLISKLEMEPEYELPSHEITISDEENQTSGFSLGELFSPEFLNTIKE